MPRNVDFICIGVEYVAAPRHLRGLEVEGATTVELQSLSQLLDKNIDSRKVRVLVSQGRRFPVVAASFGCQKMMPTFLIARLPDR